MKKTLFTLGTTACALLLFYQFSNLAHAQGAGVPEIRNIPAADFLVFKPVAGIAGIEGKRREELASTDGCVLANTEIRDGVLGISMYPSQKVFLPTENANARETGVKEYWICNIPGAQKLLYGQTTPLGSVTSSFIELLIAILWAIDQLGTILIGWSGKLLITILGQGTFIQNDLVKQAWPFVQGIANLGFIFALLYIALATTLRLESVSSSVQRLLPKLLMGALLVNFSLIIGGLLIDASRLVMAVEIQLIGGGEVGADTLSVKLLEQTKLYENVTRSLTINPVHGVPVPTQSSGWNDVIKAATRTFFILATAAGMAVFSFGLFGRYIALLILLIISPLAYLAIALPQTSSYAKEWWQNFIKWVLYGPILLFFLIIIIRVQVSNIAPVPETEAILDASFFQHIVKFIVVITLFFVSASVAKKVGGAGSASIMNFAMKRGNAALRTTGNVALGAAGYMTRTGANYAYERTGLKTQVDGYREAEKIKNASIAKQQKDAAGKTRMVQQAKYRYGTPAYREDVDNAKAIEAQPDNADITKDIFDADKLRSKEAGKAIKPKQIRSIIDRAFHEGDNNEQLQAVINNPTIVAKMNKEDKAIFNTEIKNRISNPDVGPAQKNEATQMLGTLQRSLREATKQREDDKKIPDTAPTKK